MNNKNSYFFIIIILLIMIAIVIFYLNQNLEIGFDNTSSENIVSKEVEKAETITETEISSFSTPLLDKAARKIK